MYLVRAFLVWLIIVAAETIHGTLRQIFLAPLVGDFPARRISIFTGMLLIFATALLFVRRIAASSAKSLLAVGLLWVILTVVFEIALGRFLGYSRERIFEDYDLSNGGLMAFGLAFMLFAPLLAAKLRGIKMPAAKSFQI